MRAVGESKKCSACREWKTVNDFYKSKSYPDGLTCDCKHCIRQRSAKYREKNPDVHRKWAAANQDKVAASRTKHYAKHRWAIAKLRELGIEI